MKATKVVELHQDNQVVKYNIDMAVIQEVNEKYKDITEIKDSAGYAMVMAGLREYRELRLTVDAEHKKLKKDALEYGRAVDAEKNRIRDLITPGEERLKSVRQAEDDRKAAIKAEKIRKEQERIEGIRARIADIQKLGLSLIGLSADQLKSRKAEMLEIDITEDDFQEFKAEAETVMNDTYAAVCTALEERVKADIEAAAQKAEAERLEKIRKEQAEEAARLEAEKKKIQDEKDRIQAEKDAEIARKDREAFEKKVQEEAKEKAEREAKERAEQEERDRVARERAEADEAARVEALKPDKDKLLNMAGTLNDIQWPIVSSVNAQMILKTAREGVARIANEIIKQTEEM